MYVVNMCIIIAVVYVIDVCSNVNMCIIIAVVYVIDVCMGWLRLVGCLKTYVSLQNIGLFCRVLLQKRPIFLNILLIVATPQQCMECVLFFW